MIKFVLLLILSFSAFAEDVYQTKESFLAGIFADQPPTPQVMWINKEQRNVIENILQHHAGFIRVRYWLKDNQTVWVLNEIGKEKPITVGIAIRDNHIEKLRVLVFRESRGWEVKHDFFTRQFDNIQLDENLQLTDYIDGVSGATLSVRALKKVARIALYLNQQRQQ